MTLLIKGDASFGPSEKVDIQNVVGKIIAIERNGRKRKIDTNLYRIINLFFSVISLFSQWIYAIGSVIKHNGRKLIEQLKNLQDSDYCLVAKKGDKIIGSATIAKSVDVNLPFSDWWLTGMLINWMYRGLGVDKKLTKIASKYLPRRLLINIID